MACNNDDVWNEQGASLSFTVLPQIWQTWWFRGILLLVAGGAVAAVAMWGARQRVHRRIASNWSASVPWNVSAPASRGTFTTTWARA